MGKNQRYPDLKKAIITKNLTPQKYEVSPAMGNCPAIFETSAGSFVVIGKQLTKEEIQQFGIENRVGEDECVFQIPNDLINIQKP